MERIVITRTSQYTNSLRKYDIFIDDIKAATISNGETKIIELAEGAHSIYLKLDWCQSKKISFKLNSNQEIKFKCGSRITGLKNAFAVVYSFSKDQFVYLERV